MPSNLMRCPTYSSLLGHEHHVWLFPVDPLKLFLQYANNLWWYSDLVLAS